MVDAEQRTPIYMPRRTFPPTIAKEAPTNVLMKLTTSFVIQAMPFFSWSVAPMTLSTLVAKKAAHVQTATEGASIIPIRLAYAESKKPPTTAAAVPSIGIRMVTKSQLSSAMQLWKKLAAALAPLTCRNGSFGPGLHALERCNEKSGLSVGFSYFRSKGICEFGCQGSHVCNNKERGRDVKNTRLCR
jgi:hypothetical protein